MHIQAEVEGIIYDKDNHGSQILSVVLCDLSVPSPPVS